MKWCLCFGVAAVGWFVTGCGDSEADPVAGGVASGSAGVNDVSKPVVPGDPKHPGGAGQRGVTAGISGGGQWDKQIVQYGRMHEVIGLQKHHGRILLGDAIKRPNLFAVGALETLAGEVTILDGVVYASAVDSSGQIAPLASPSTLKAALLVGSHVTEWTEHVAGKLIASTEYDTFLESAANKAGIDTSKPFVFTITGELRNVHVHVIHGACPVHAKRSGKTLPKEQEPYSGTFATLQGTLVGVFAKNAAGKITHPGNSTHTHVVFTDPKTGRKLTGHVESAGVSVTAVLRLPR